MLVAAIVGTLIVGSVLIESVGKVGLYLMESLFILPPLIYLQLKGYNIKRCLRWNGISVQLLFTTLMIGLALIILLDEADRLINMFFPMPAEMQEALKDLMTLESWSDYILIGFGAVFAAAICEESLFRGFIQVSMEAYGSVTRAVLFSALLFGLAHFNPWWMVQILILGVFLGFISWRSNSAIPGMFIHGLNNGLALLVGGALVGDDWAWYNAGEHVSPSVLIAAAALLFLGLKYFIGETESTFPKEAENHETAAG